jgi:Protein of unknown function (DUF3037)
MPAREVFEYAIIRIVPRVEREEFINAGVVLFCRTRQFLDARIALDAERLNALAPHLDIAAVQEQLSHIPLVCVGGAAAGPIGSLPQPERFRWLVAPRSTIVQPSPVHAGLCDDPQAELDRLVATMVGQ